MRDIGIRPETLLREIGETEFIRRYQCAVRTLAAFEKSEHADDWRELMRLYLVRRTRSFIQDNYAQTDEASGSQVPDVPGRHALRTSRRGVRARSSSRSTTTIPTISTPCSTPLRSSMPSIVLLCRAMASAITWTNARTTPPTPAEARIIQDLPCRKAADGLLPHESLQAAGEQRPGLHPVRRAPHPAQLRLPACDRGRPAPPHRHPGCQPARRPLHRHRARPLRRRRREQ